MLPYYRLATHIAAPLIPLWLRLRAMRGKEDKGRMAERFGKSNYARPAGKLLWIHASSVGEANSALALIHQIKKRFSTLGILLTTGTVTSAALMKQRLPQGVLHQYSPVDTPEATERFMRHWHPDIAWFVESELWPNLIDKARSYHCLMALINARMSEKSFLRWQKHPGFARQLLSAFRVSFAQSEADAGRLRTLGAPKVLTVGNIKYDAPPLGCNEAELLSLQKSLAGRTLWLAASTHPGEEEIIAKVHALISPSIPNLLTVIVPRHAIRGADIANKISSLGKSALRSKKQLPAKDTAFYIADTMGELGLFYRLCEVVFMGGSLVEHGGQNPLEPAQLSCAVISGPHTYNFREIYSDLHKAQAAIRVDGGGQLAAQVHGLLAKPDTRAEIQSRAKAFTQERTGGSLAIMDIFTPVFSA